MKKSISSKLYEVAKLVDVSINRDNHCLRVTNRHLHLVNEELREDILGASNSLSIYAQRIAQLEADNRRMQDRLEAYMERTRMYESLILDCNCGRFPDSLSHVLRDVRDTDSDSESVDSEILHEMFP